ncbi:MAG: sigma-70 family RNA polymerase sigma factor [Proteobacteria bacterium]|nr:sigma-70 family RNA polymerase sigma factor [Pseudomonadota bacterium]
MRDRDGLDNNPLVSRQALEALHHQLYGWSLSRCGYDRTAAEDLMQQAYVEILSGRARFDDKSSLKTFMFGVVQMLAKMRFRKLKSMLRLVDAVAANAEKAVAAPLSVDDDRSRMVWLAVQALPSRQRDITELVFCREMTIEDASSVMGISTGTGRAHYARAKKTLARTLSSLQPDLETMGDQYA